MKNKKQNRKQTWVKIKRNYQLYLILIPMVIYVFVFSYIPIYGVTLAFKEYHFDTGLLFSPWVGFKYFKSFFQYYDFWRLIRNTLIISFFKLFLYFPFPIILALLINEIQHNAFKRIVQTISYLPNFISWAAAVIILQQFLGMDGIVNNIRAAYGLKKIFFMNLPQNFYPIMFFSYIWKSVGMGSIIYISAISGIDPELYESAMMDGAGHFKQVIYITIPEILPLATVMFILSLGSIMSAGWDQIYLLRTPGNAKLADIIDTYVLDVGLSGGQYSYGSAVSLFQSLIGLVLVLTTNKIAKMISGSSLF